MRDEQIKVLIVEDVRSVALALASLLSPFDVVGMAGNGREALRLIRAHEPDVITMDIVLPDVDGIALTRDILAERQVPIIIVSAQVEPERQRLVFDALRTGAYDVIAKSKLLPSHGDSKTAARLVRLVRSAAHRETHPAGSRGRAERRRKDAAAKPTRASGGRRERRRGSPASYAGPPLVAIGASTGGPPLLREILCDLGSAPGGSFLIAQHMAEGFTDGLVRWLDHQSPLQIRTASAGAQPESGCVYFPPTTHHLLLGRDGTLRLEPCGGETICPSVDRLFHSVADVAGARGIGVLLTGMGADGADGLSAMHDRGGLTAVQDKDSCVVSSMPRSALERCPDHAVLPKVEIAPGLLEQIVAVASR